MKRVMLLASKDLCETLGNELGKTFIVIPCVDAMEADEVLLSKPDALLLNILLPGMDGLKYLKANAEKLPSVVIAITPLISCNLLSELDDLGVLYLFRIPFDLELLRNRLSELLSKKCLS